METRYEYGILWPGIELEGEVEDCDKREDAERILALHPLWGGRLVVRKVIVGDWTEVAS